MSDDMPTTGGLPAVIDAEFEVLASGADPETALAKLAENSGLTLDQLSPGLRRNLEAGIRLADAALAPSTRDVYERAFTGFELWCAEEQLTPLPASVMAVLAYIGHLEEDLRLSASRINVAVSAVAWQHRRRRLPDPTTDTFVSLALKGVRREQAGTRTKRQAKALVANIGETPDGTDDVALVVDAITGDDLASLRDRALILLGWAGAFRRSEVASLRIGDLVERPDGIWIPARKSKTDQEGKGAEQGQGKAIHLADNPARCPVRAVRRWLEVLEAATGREAAAGQQGRLELPVFVGLRAGKKIRAAWGEVIGREQAPRAEAMTGQAVNDVVKARTAAVGLDASAMSGHSLRRGFSTTALENGKDIFAVQAQTGHKTIQTLAGYKATVDAFARGAGKGLL